MFTEPADLILCLFSLQMERMITGIKAMYIISIITLLLTITGVYGACKERQWALIVVGKEKNTLLLLLVALIVILVAVMLCLLMSVYMCVSVCSRNEPEQFIHVCL